MFLTFLNKICLNFFTKKYIWIRISITESYASASKKDENNTGGVQWYCVKKSIKKNYFKFAPTVGLDSCLKQTELSISL